MHFPPLLLSLLTPTALAWFNCEPTGGGDGICKATHDELNHKVPLFQDCAPKNGCKIKGNGCIMNAQSVWNANKRVWESRANCSPDT
ncbi:hypothetical protein EJ03DRAFT_354458 [Teratosphaeria nubilosa]|uniref:Uncharacterized protein n=1 Tax=Teratosphaeria nubilosa TaxID=161662 RepID=A0A6G1KZ53_9PEZI|nr:hypothetical protein EJ03DRAFT_354458 [Teratosphaeria nubilosa]